MVSQAEVTLTPGNIFPDLELNLLTGKRVMRVLFPGRSGGKWSILLLYCGNSCLECRRQLVAFHEMIRGGHRDNVRFVAVSDDKREQVVKMMWDLRVSFPVAFGLDPAQIKSRMGIVHGTGKGDNHPTAFLIDPDGMIANTYGGSQSPAEWLRAAGCFSS